MKKLIALFLIMLLAVFPAVAEGLADFEGWSADLQALYEGAWKEDGDVRVLKAGENTTISACLSGKDVAVVTIEAMQGEDLRKTAYAAINALGGIDSEILFAINDLDEAELILDGCVVGHLAGENRECIYIAPEEGFEDLLWEPVHGGDQLHEKPGCSGMDVPRLITAEAAEKTGYDVCDRCVKDAEQRDGVRE